MTGHSSLQILHIQIFDKLFPVKLYILLENESTDTVSWVASGKAFRIYSTEKFQSVIIPKYFKHTKLTSFQRQLNLYGFRRITKGEDQGAYFHPRFQYGRGEDVMEIRRLPGKSAADSNLNSCNSSNSSTSSAATTSSSLSSSPSSSLSAMYGHGYSSGEAYHAPVKDSLYISQNQQPDPQKNAAAITTTTNPRYRNCAPFTEIILNGSSKMSNLSRRLGFGTQLKNIRPQYVIREQFSTGTGAPNSHGEVHPATKRLRVEDPLINYFMKNQLNADNKCVSVNDAEDGAEGNSQSLSSRSIEETDSTVSLADVSGWQQPLNSGAPGGCGNAVAVSIPVGTNSEFDLAFFDNLEDGLGFSQGSTASGANDNLFDIGA